MDLNRAKVVDEQFFSVIKQHRYPQLDSKTMPESVGLNKDVFLDLFHSQCVSRHIDLIARRLKETGKTFYTISSSGHEGNAAIAHAFELKDIAFLHYRSGAFMIQRAKKISGYNYIYEQLLSLMASKEYPISGGRHKVFGSLQLNVPPQTSTIASHLPKALGTALSIIWAKSVNLEGLKKLEYDSVVLCSFGDASANHSTALGAFNAAGWIMRQGLQLPIVFICEDNGWGISVPTPPDWIEQAFQSKPYIQYLSCDGRNLADVYQAACQAQEIARGSHQPVFLHMKTVRLLGHAGSDIEFHYRKEKDIASSEADDPLLHTAHLIRMHDWLSEEEIIERYAAIKEEVQVESERALARPKLSTAADIQSSLIPPRRIFAPLAINIAERNELLGKQAQWLKEPRNMAQHINLALTDLMLQYPNIVVFGEDVGAKGGVYRVTQELQTRFGSRRVFDTILDEQTILGTAIGFAHNGFIPMPEIQFLAYTHNAIDQIRGEAATLSFFSQGQFTNPMVIRIPALAYQKGFGGHFHNDNAIGFLREIPGIIVATPSQAKDATLILRECVRLAAEEQRVVIFLEPIALYMLKDKYAPEDHHALQIYPDHQERIVFQSVGVEGDTSANIVIISYANGMHLSRQAALQLKEEYQLDVLLIDLRWLHPLPVDQILPLVSGKQAVLVVDECRKSGSLSEAVLSNIVESIKTPPRLSRLCAEDCFIPLGDAFEKILPSKETIIHRILELVQEEHHARSISDGNVI